MWKKALCLIFAFLLSIESMAAVVSDNDGSAFITKAEFEAMKKDFNEQIDNYNTSIDSKIDGAIASYLAGINITKEPENFWQKLMENTNNNFWWINKWESGTQTLVPNVVANITRDLYITSYKATGYGWWPSGWNTSNGSIYNMRHWIWGASGETNFDFENKYPPGGRTDTITSTGTSNTITAGSNKENLEQNIGTATVEGSGSRWIMHVQPNGELVVRKYSKEYYPVILINVWNHVYHNLRKTGSAAQITESYYGDGKRSYKTKGTGTVPNITSFGKVTSGTKYTEKSTNNGNYIEANMLLNDVNDGVNYENRMIWGTNVNNTIYYSLDTALPTKDTAAGDKEIETDTYQFNDLYHTATQEKVQKNEIYGYKLTYNYYNIVYNTMKLSGCQNVLASNVSGETVKLAQGVKIVENTSEETELNFKISFKANPNTGTVTYTISDKKFNEDGSLASGANTISSGSVAVGTDVVFDTLAASKQQFWINLRSDTLGSEATIDKFSVKAK